MTDRVPRADARRNRALVLEAAEAVFAAEGLAVPIDEIARRAGVGVGTVYRHFPTKEALFEAIVLARMEQLEADARAHLAAEDAGEAFYAFLGRLVEEGGGKKDLVDALAGSGYDVKSSAARQRMVGAMGELLARAQRAGAVRDDIGAGDLMALVSAIFVAPDRAVRRRVAGVVCDGLRPRRTA